MYTSNVGVNFNIANLNSPGSNYATLYGKEKSKLIADVIQRSIFDDTPKDYYEIPLLYLNEAEVVDKAEFSWMEMNIQRVPIETPVLGSTIAAGVQQTIPLNNLTDITLDRLVVRTDNNQMASVIDVDPTGYFTIQAQTGETLSVLSSGSSYKWINQSSIDADARTNITGRYRMDKLIERYNLVQQFATATEFGREELWTYNRVGTTNYVPMTRDQLRKQYKMDLVASYWNGKRGEVTLSDGKVGKTMGGIYPTMLAAGSPYITTTLSTIVDGIFTAAYQSRFDSGENLKFLYGRPEAISKISREVKMDKMWWESTNAFGAEFKLEMISDASNRIVLVPCGTFERRSGTLPDFYENLLFLLPQQKIKPVIMWGMRVGAVDSRENNSATLATSKVEYIEGTLSQKMPNPLEAAIIKLQ
jgi:hypothetical protein